MTGHERESQLSAMFDGELPAEECELLARRLSRDEQMRRSYAHYALIGSVIRNEPLASGAFADKVHGALRAGSVTAVASSSRTAQGETQATEALAGMSAEGAAGVARARNRWAWPLGAVGLAASVAVVALLSLDPATIQSPASPSMVADQATEMAVVEEVVTARESQSMVAEVIIPDRPTSLEPESYVTPPVEGLVPERKLAPTIQLANYVVAHGTVSAPMMRHSALSAFITDQEGVMAPGAAPTNASRPSGASEVAPQ